MYWEGDYSSQVDILILSWRQWEDNYFPPPDDLLGHNDPLAHPQHHVEHTVSANNSSSSSNSAPSKPTIDISSWSPRSSRLEVLNSAKWMPKSKSTQKKLAGTCSENTLTPFPYHTSLPTSVRLSMVSQPSPSQKPPILATEDPTHRRDSQWNTLIFAILLSLPPPIEIKLLPAITPEHSTFRAAQNNRPSPLSHMSPLPHPTPSMNLALATAFKTPIQMMQRAVLYFITMAINRLGGPFWPISINSSRSAPNPA